MASILEQLKLHEGLKLKPYPDSVGKLTIGIGRNLDDRGISREEAYQLCANDICNVTNQLEQHGWYNQLDTIRKKIITDMGFNLGVPGLLKFKNMIQCIKDKQYIAAANEMRDSRWHNQVGKRALRLEKMMRTGEDYA